MCPEPAEGSGEEPTYRVVVNHEDRHSLWPADRMVPAGWHDEGTRGSRADCLRRIEQVWTNPGPRSARARTVGAA